MFTTLKPGQGKVIALQQSSASIEKPGQKFIRLLVRLYKKTSITMVYLRHFAWL